MNKVIRALIPSHEHWWTARVKKRKINKYLSKNDFPQPPVFRELCPSTAFYYFWECCISQTMALVSVVINFPEMFSINRIIKFERKGHTEKVCCVCKMKDNREQDICPKTDKTKKHLPLIFFSLFSNSVIASSSYSV